MSVHPDIPDWQTSRFFDIRNPPNLAEAHTGDYPNWDYQARGVDEQTYRTIMRNAYHPLSDSVLTTVCELVAYETHCYQAYNAERLAQGLPAQGCLPGHNETNDKIAGRFVTYHMNSIYQARISYVYFPENWDDLKSFNFSELVAKHLKARLQAEQNQWRTYGICDGQPEQRLVNLNFQKVKAYNARVERALQQPGSGVKALEALISMSGGARGVHPLHDQNWEFVKGMVRKEKLISLMQQEGDGAQRQKNDGD